jgi:hypothetical protein
LFTVKCLSEVRKFSVDGDGRPVKMDINGLIDLEVDGLVEMGKDFDCLVKELKKGIGEIELETTSK